MVAWDGPVGVGVVLLLPPQDGRPLTATIRTSASILRIIASSLRSVWDLDLEYHGPPRETRQFRRKPAVGSRRAVVR